MELDNWQKDILDANGHILLCTGRQVGKTTIFAAKAAERMVKEPGCRIVAVSLTEDQAFLMRFMVEDYLKKNHPTFLKVAKKDKPTKNKIKLNNKSVYTVRPVGNTGDAVRGFTADVLIVDEAAYMPELMWLAAKPTLLTTAGDIWMCSTPHGKTGYFYDCFENKHKRFKVFHISSEDVIYNRAISEDWTALKRTENIRFLEEEKADMSEMRYAQEYMGEFVDDLRRWFTEEWIERVCSLDTKMMIQKNFNRYMGVDIARMGEDHTAFEIVQKHDDKIFHLYHEVAKKWLTTQTEDRIIDLTQTYSLSRIFIDAGAGSLGVGILDHLKRIDSTKRIVEPVNNRSIVTDKDGKRTQRLLKEDLYDNLRALGERQKLKLLNLPEIKLALRCIQYEYIKNANGRTHLNIFASPHNAGDIVEALIRAACCSKEKNIRMLISSFPI